MRYDFADCCLDTESLTLTRAGAPVPVEPQVFDLLRLLVENAGRVVTKDEIVDRVWRGRIVSESAISARIAAARKAVGDNGKAQRVIRTVARRGLAMRVTPEVHETTRARGPSVAPRIRYTRSATGQSLAYAVSGQGPPVVRAGYMYTDISAEWDISAERTLFERIGARNTLLRYDPVGTGQSDLALEEVDFAAMAEDLIAVADAAGFDRFAVFSESGGVTPALHAAATHPDRITKLAILGGYVDGRLRRLDQPQPGPDPIRGLIEEAWSKGSESFAAGYLTAYFPEGPLEAIQGFAKIMMAACPRENILKLRDAVNWVENGALLERIRCPTLVMHGRHDGVHPLTEARKLAAGIPDAELIALETANLMPMPGNAAFEPFVGTLTRFLSSPP